jgi:hypothetical protein
MNKLLRCVKTGYWLKAKTDSLGNLVSSLLASSHQRPPTPYFGNDTSIYFSIWPASGLLIGSNYEISALELCLHTTAFYFAYWFAPCFFSGLEVEERRKDYTSREP